MTIPVVIYEHGSNNKCVFSYETRRDVDSTSRISPRSNSSTETGIRIRERGGEERYFDGGTKMAPSRELRERKGKRRRNLQFSNAEVGAAGSARLPLLISGFRELGIGRERLSAN